MTYGIRITNANGEIVIDDQYPVLTIGQEVTLTGTPNTTGEAGLYNYPNFYSGLTNIAFVQLGVGDFVLRGPSTTVVSNRPSLNVRKVLLASDKPVSSGFGLAVYNAQGDLCYDAGSDLVSVRDLLALPDFSQVNNTTADWVCLLETSYTWAFVQGGSALLYFGVLRETAGTQKRAAAAVLYIPGEVTAPYTPLNPTRYITAD